MQLTPILGNSHYIRGGTNTGVFVMADGGAVVIDPGLSTIRGRKIARCLEESSLRAIACICSHEHLDHYEAYTGLLEIFPDCAFYCPKETKPFLETPELFFTYIYGGKPHKKLLGNTKAEIFDFDITETLGEQTLSFAGGSLGILDLKGHSHGMAGVLTPDKVLFLSDALIDYNLMKKYEFPFIFHVDHFLDSLAKIRETDFDRGLIAHSREIYDRQEILRLADINEENVLKYLEQIESLLQRPMSRENLLAAIIQNNGFDFNYKEYHYYYSTLGSMLSRLINEDRVDYTIENGILSYYRR